MVKSSAKAYRPTPEVQQRELDVTWTSLYTGFCLIPATVFLGIFGGIGFLAGSSLAGSLGEKIGLGVGLAFGTLVMVLLLRRFEEKVRRRSPNLHRAMWIATWLSLLLIVVMAYVPQLAFPY